MFFFFISSVTIMKKRIYTIVIYLGMTLCFLVELGIILAIIFGLYHAEFDYETATREPGWNRRFIIFGTFLLVLFVQYVSYKVLRKVNGNLCIFYKKRVKT